MRLSSAGELILMPPFLLPWVMPIVHLAYIKSMFTAWLIAVLRCFGRCPELFFGMAAHFAGWNDQALEEWRLVFRCVPIPGAVSLALQSNLRRSEGQ